MGVAGGYFDLQGYGKKQGCSAICLGFLGDECALHPRKYTLYFEKHNWHGVCIITRTLTTKGTPKQDCTGVILHKELPNFLRCIRGASTEPPKKLISAISSCFANRFRLAFFLPEFWNPKKTVACHGFWVSP